MGSGQFARGWAYIFGIAASAVVVAGVLAVAITPNAPITRAEAVLERASVRMPGPLMMSHDIGDVASAPPASAAPLSGAGGSGTYIVLFEQEPLASYKGGLAGLPAPKRKLTHDGRMRLDPKSPESEGYVAHLARYQKAMEGRISSALGTSIPVRLRMQHALDGIVVDLSRAEASKVARMSGVRLVEPYREMQLLTDVGPALIGAGNVWAGNAPPSSPGYKGEGMIIGVLDSGINYNSPSFAATGPVDGYVHINPLGSGIYQGTCASGGADVGRCNDKLIGGYDFVCNAPANQCGKTDVTEEPGFGDTNGHGSHVASTAAGNVRDIVYSAAPLRISGVAPHANIVAYDVCYTKTSTGDGLCPSTSAVAAVNRAVADGVVDALNFSVGGGVDPWQDSVSLAFLNAVNAGIYVAAAAGNEGPATGTLNHNEPWVGTTAAATHGRGGFGIVMAVTGPSPIPSNVSAVVATQGAEGVVFSSSIGGSTRMIVSPGIDTTTDACNAYAAGTFSGAIALVRRGNCSFTIKANNASAAGAIAVVIANNTTGGLIPSVPGTTVPVFAVSLEDGNSLRDFGVAHPANATATLPYPPVGIPNAPDVLGDFSSRGPAGNYELLKPDMTAPGVNIIAAVAGSPSAVAVYSGTSMATPHHAGAVLLVRQVRPTWTPIEVKSALMMTATDQVYLENGVTPATPFAAGAGRIRVDRAVNAGLLLNETMANFQAANPGSGGTPVTLNLPSMADATCNPPSCTFVRTFRNTRTYGALWLLSLEGLAGSVPTLVWFPAGASVQVTVTIDASQLPADTNWHFGKLVMRERFTGQIVDALSELHLPVGVMRTVAKSQAFYPGITKMAVQSKELINEGNWFQAERVGPLPAGI